MDAASHPENVGFITCPQLSEVLHGVGIRLSPVEIELLATGAVSSVIRFFISVYNAIISCSSDPAFCSILCLNLEPLADFDTS